MKNRFLEAVQIITKYEPEAEPIAEHDQLWLGSFDAVTDEKDKKRLEELGWFEECESWSRFT